jgi:hypothetical protein
MGIRELSMQTQSGVTDMLHENITSNYDVSKQFKDKAGYPTNCQAKNAKSRSTPSASFQLQQPWENLLSVKPRMPGADQHHQLHSSSSHHERTYSLSSQECQEQINTIRFIPAPATARELTLCQAKNARSRSTPWASFQLQPSWENLLSVKPRMPGADQHHQLHSSSSHHERTYSLSSQECQE